MQLQESLGAPENWAIYSISVFWAAMVVGRLGCAFIPERVPYVTSLLLLFAGLSMVCLSIKLGPPGPSGRDLMGSPLASLLGATKMMTTVITTTIMIVMTTMAMMMAMIRVAMAMAMRKIMMAIYRPAAGRRSSRKG